MLHSSVALWAVVATLVVPRVARGQVVLNEVLANPDAEPTEEWAELYNAGSAQVDLGSWSLSDSNGHGSSGSVTLELGTTIAAGGYLVVVLRASDGLLNNAGDDVELYNANGELVDEVTWSSTAQGDLSLARVPDGDDWSTSWGVPTPGASNGEALSTASGGLARTLAAAGPVGGVASCNTASGTDALYRCRR